MLIKTTQLKAYEKQTEKKFAVDIAFGHNICNNDKDNHVMLKRLFVGAISLLSEEF